MVDVLLDDPRGLEEGRRSVFRGSGLIDRLICPIAVTKLFFLIAFF